MSKRHTFEYIMTKWWEREHTVCNRPYTPLTFKYHDNYGSSPDSDIKQTDGISCGVSALLHAYHVIVMNQFATYKDFNFTYMPRIRKYLGYIIYTKGLHDEVLLKNLSILKRKALHDSKLSTHLFMSRAIRKQTILKEGEDDDVIYVNHGVADIEDENESSAPPSILSQQLTAFNIIVGDANRVPTNLKPEEMSAYFDDLMFMN
jgi:hypothetical protein